MLLSMDTNVKCAELLRSNGKYFFVCSDCGEICNDPNSIISHVDVHRSSQQSQPIANVKVELNESAILAEFLTTSIKGEDCIIPPEEVYVNESQHFDLSSTNVDLKLDSLCEIKSSDDDGEYQEIEVKLKKCKLCEDTFESRELLNYHESTVHDIVNKRYECEMCSTTFFGAITFKRHFKKNHLTDERIEITDKPYKCNLCAKTFRHYKPIKLHVDTEHDEETNLLSFTCQYCGKIFEQLCSLTRHLQTIHIDTVRKQGIETKLDKKRPHNCDICFKEFTLTNSLRNHLAVIHGRSDLLNHSYKCEHCAKIFAIKSRLDLHIERSHSSTADMKSEVKEIQALKKKVLKKKTYKKKKINSSARAVKRKATIDDGKPKPYKCDVCLRGFTLRTSLKNHLAVIHARDDLLQNSYKCKLCDKIFAILSRLELHMRKKHKIDEKLSTSRKFYCPRCDVTTSSNVTLQMHLSEHSESDEYISLKCDMCNRVFYNKSKLEKHINQHQNLRQHKCEICNGGFNSISRLKSHMTSHNERTFKCNVCDFAAKTQRTLDSHISNKHSEIEHQYICKLCGQSFKYKNTYDCHMRRHNNEKPFQCFMCGKAYYTSGNLNTHVKLAHSTTIFPCEFTNCDKLFQSQLRLKIHLKTHATVLQYGCDVCGKKFKTDKTLRQHKLIHDTVKRYKCNYCDMRFTQSSGRRGHERLRHLLA